MQPTTAVANRLVDRYPVGDDGVVVVLVAQLQPTLHPKTVDLQSPRRSLYPGFGSWFRTYETVVGGYLIPPAIASQRICAFSPWSRNSPGGRGLLISFSSLIRQAKAYKQEPTPQIPT